MKRVLKNMDIISMLHLSPLHNRLDLTMTVQTFQGSWGWLVYWCRSLVASFLGNTPSVKKWSRNITLYMYSVHSEHYVLEGDWLRISGLLNWVNIWNTSHNTFYVCCIKLDYLLIQSQYIYSWIWLLKISVSP